ncbi:MAG: hypothetical protein NXH85_13870 [Pseudomonadaceae bacterium]|nr:hypothetical protein [Pseudomonadaceae bacterium]
MTDEDGQILDYTQERAKLAREQRRKVALEARVLADELVPANEVTLALEQVFSVVRARLLSIPTKAAPVAVAMREAQIEALLATEISDALSSLATATLTFSAGVRLGTTEPPGDPEGERRHLEH